ncbi:hypothetical protein D3C80_523460 [compost metagenome]
MFHLARLVHHPIIIVVVTVKLETYEFLFIDDRRLASDAGNDELLARIQIQGAGQGHVLAEAHVPAFAITTVFGIQRVEGQLHRQFRPL